jgi:hypothetical protein
MAPPLVWLALLHYCPYNIDNGAAHSRSSSDRSDYAALSDAE